MWVCSFLPLHSSRRKEYSQQFVHSPAGGRQGKIPSVAFEVFDFDKRQWSSLPDIPSKRVFAMYATDEKHIFSVGGLLQPASQGFSDVCEAFNIEKG